ncbi:MAG TPA: hypothetical protein PJ982_14575 [Lacipirellulaceae bacterium]|nr:hypothetical protein [Lacipirellulaceae bacterium]
MGAVGTLTERIDAEFSASQGRWEELRARHIEAFQLRRQRLERFEQTVDALRTLWEPKLDALAQRFGKNMAPHPIVEPGRRGLLIEFESKLANVTLFFGVSPDEDVQTLIFTYDVEILPALMDFTSHDELCLALDSVDEAQLAAWLDDRIVDFVQAFVALYDNPYYLQDHLFEDPIAKVKFPKFAAAATLEHNGEVLHFIAEATLLEFQQRSQRREEPTTGVRLRDARVS